MPDKDDTVSLYLEDEKPQKRKPFKDTPFGRLDYTNRAEFEKKLISKFQEQKLACENFRASYFDDMWLKCDRAYYGTKKNINLNDAEKEYRSNVRIRYAYKQVESQTSKVVPSIINQQPPCSVFPNDDNSEIRELKAKGVQKILQYNMFQRQNGQLETYKWVKQGERLGLSPMKMVWSYETGSKIVRKPVYDPETGEVIGLEKEVYKDSYIKKDHPTIQTIDTRRIWWNPDATDPDTDLRYVFEEYYRPVSYLQAQKDIYFNTEGLSGELEDDEDEQQRTGGQSRYINTGEEMVKVTERWDENNLIVEAQGKLIRYRDNPFDDGIIPYYFYRSTILEDQFVGMGVIEPMLDLEELANTIANQRIDNINRIVHKMIFIGASAGWKGKRRLRFRPGGVEQVMDVGQIKEFQMADVTSSSYLEQQKAAAEMDSINGDPEVGRGESPSGGRETATSVTARTQGASFRIEMKTEFAQLEQGRIYRDMYRLEKQFGDSNKWVKVMGANGQEYNMRHDSMFIDDYEYDYTLDGFSGNRLIDFQQLMLGLERMHNIGLEQEFDRPELARIVAERSNIRGIDKILKKPALVSEGYYRDPYEENTNMFYFKQSHEVLPGEQHNKHIPVHSRLLDVPDLPLEVIAVVKQHLDMHKLFFMQEQQAQAGAQQAQMAQMAQMLAGGAPGMDTAAQQGAVLPGGVTQGGANVIQ